MTRKVPKLERPDMRDTVYRQDVIDAIAGERLNEDTGSEGDAAYERALDDALAAINAIPAVDEWQPIESAPKDGTVFITYSPPVCEGDTCNFDFAEWDTDLEDFCKHGCGWQFATHWRPLPKPPLVAALGE